MPRRSHLVVALFASVWACASGVAGCVADDTAAEPSLGPRGSTAPPPSSGTPDATLPDGSLDAASEGGSDASSDAGASEDTGRPDADASDAHALDAEPMHDASDAGDG